MGNNEDLSVRIGRFLNSPSIINGNLLKKWIEHAKHLEAALNSARTNNESLNSELGNLIAAAEKAWGECDHDHVILLDAARNAKYLYVKEQE